MEKRALVCVVLTCLALEGASRSFATIITLQAGTEYSNGASPTGAGPWLTATFDDGNASGAVKLTLTATNLTNSEFVTGWYLNLDPTLDPTRLVFSSPVKAGSFTTPTIRTGADAFKAAGGGEFDIELDFSTSGGLTKRFTAGDSVSYTMTGIPSLTAGSFNSTSTPKGGNGVHLIAAHIQGIGPQASQSGWVGVPEPASVLLLAAGILTTMRRKPR